MNIRPISFTSNSVTRPNTLNSNKTNSIQKSVSFGMTESEHSEKMFWQLFEELKQRYNISKDNLLMAHAQDIDKTPEFLAKVKKITDDTSVKLLLKQVLNNALNQNIPK